MKKAYIFSVENRRTEYLKVVAESEEEAREKLEDFDIEYYHDKAEDDYYIDEAQLKEVIEE